MSKSPTSVVRNATHPQDQQKARAAGSRAASDSGQEPPFEDALRMALETDRIADARTLVANAEAVLAAHGASDPASADRTTQAQLAAAKARIAMATNDGAAARAILVRAIEKNPKAPALRALMTEVMMAAGRATDVRPVLQHLGNDVEIGRDPSSDMMPNPPTRRDTSG
ncbi:tetratricopeptide repeat protein [Gymnodinialimonas sp.]